MTDSIDTSDREANEPREPIRLPVREMRDEPAPELAAAGGGVPQGDELHWQDVELLTALVNSNRIAPSESSALYRVLDLLASSPQPEAEQAAREFGREFAQVFPGAQPEAAPQWVPCKCFDETSRRLCINKDRCSRVEAYNAPASGSGPKLSPQISGFAQPEAAPAVAQVPIGYVSEQQLPLIKDPDDESGQYIPMRKTPAGNFTMALYAAASEAPAQADDGKVVVTWNHDRTRILAVTRQNTEGQILKVIAEAPAQAAQSAGEVERVLRSFEITGPDADGLLWLVLHGSGTTGKAMFQLGLPDRLAGQVAMMLEQDRRAALSHKEQR